MFWITQNCLHEFFLCCLVNEHCFCSRKNDATQTLSYLLKKWDKFNNLLLLTIIFGLIKEIKAFLLL